MKGYKGFNEKLQCTPDNKVFQYEVGKEYVHPGDPVWCNTGFHFCENPLDVLAFYPPTGRFAEIEANDVKTNDSIKWVAKKLKVTAELSLSALCELGVKFILDKVNFTDATATNTGDQSAATNTGDQSAATNTGDQSAATNTGDQSAATNTGEEGYAASLGIEGRAKGAIGCWLTLAEWQEIDNTWHRVDVQTKKVDGKNIKADTFYQLKNGKFTKVKE